jgi:hypothetical protein
MKISFFEEFPNTENLEKLELINFPTKLYLADSNIKKYKVYRKYLKDKYSHLEEVIWWPTLKIQDGYWLSPWTKRRALLTLFHSLSNENFPILWDAEYPRKRSLFFTEFLNSFKNKEMIKRFFQNYKSKIYTAEYMADNFIMEMNFLNFDPKIFNNIKIKMLYNSMHEWLTESRLRKMINNYKDKYGDKVIIGLGLLAPGVESNSKVLTKEQLERDLKICKEAGIKEVVLFRLGGLNKEYLNIIKKFT